MPRTSKSMTLAGYFEAGAVGPGTNAKERESEGLHSSMPMLWTVEFDCHLAVLLDPYTSWECYTEKFLTWELPWSLQGSI
jgi:hypothetical protein